MLRPLSWRHGHLGPNRGGCAPRPATFVLIRPELNFGGHRTASRNGLWKDPRRRLFRNPSETATAASGGCPREQSRLTLIAPRKPRARLTERACPGQDLGAAMRRRLPLPTPLRRVRKLHIEPAQRCAI